MLLDHVTMLVATSHDHTPIRPASSAARTVAKSGKNAAAEVSPAARSGSVFVGLLTSSLSILLKFDLSPRGVKAVPSDY